MSVRPCTLEFFEQLSQYIDARQSGLTREELESGMVNEVKEFWVEKTEAVAKHLVENQEEDKKAFQRLKQEVEATSLKDAQAEVRSLSQAIGCLREECASLCERLVTFEDELDQRTQKISDLKALLQQEAKRRLIPSYLQECLARIGSRLSARISTGNPFSHGVK